MECTTTARVGRNILSSGAAVLEFSMEATAAAAAERSSRHNGHDLKRSTNRDSYSLSAFLNPKVAPFRTAQGGVMQERSEAPTLSGQICWGPSNRTYGVL